MDTQLLASVTPTHFLGHTLSHSHPYSVVVAHTCSQYQLTYMHSPPSPTTHTDAGGHGPGIAEKQACNHSKTTISKDGHT